MTKSIAEKHGRATFMPKPIEGLTGNGAMRIFQSGAKMGAKTFRR